MCSSYPAFKLHKRHLHYSNRLKLELVTLLHRSDCERFVEHLWRFFLHKTVSLHNGLKRSRTTWHRIVWCLEDHSFPPTDRSTISSQFNTQIFALVIYRSAGHTRKCRKFSSRFTRISNGQNIFLERMQKKAHLPITVYNAANHVTELFHLEDTIKHREKR